MIRGTTTALAACMLVFSVGCTGAEVIHREARSFETAPAHAAMARCRVAEPARILTARRVGDAKPTVTTETPARLQLTELPALDPKLLFQLRWAAYLERNDFTDRTKRRFIAPAAKAWGKRYGGYVAAYNAALAQKGTGS